MVVEAEKQQGEPRAGFSIYRANARKAKMQPVITQIDVSRNCIRLTEMDKGDENVIYFDDIYGITVKQEKQSHILDIYTYGVEEIV